MQATGLNFAPHFVRYGYTRSGEAAEQICDILGVKVVHLLFLQAITGSRLAPPWRERTALTERRSNKSALGLGVLVPCNVCGVYRFMILYLQEGDRHCNSSRVFPCPASGSAGLVSAGDMTSRP